MPNRIPERESTVISIAVVVCLIHLAAFALIAISMWTFYRSPLVQLPIAPSIRGAQVFRGHLVMPYYIKPAEDQVLFRFIDLQTGKYRETDVLPSLIASHGLVTDGKRLWSIGDDNQIFETDGTNSVTYRTEHTLKSKNAGVDRAFLYEGMPAIIDHGDDASALSHLVFRVGKFVGFEDSA